MHSTLSRLNWDPIAKVGIPCFFRHMTFSVSVPHPNLVPEVGKSQYVYFITNALSGEQHLRIRMVEIHCHLCDVATPIELAIYSPPKATSKIFLCKG